MSENVIVAPRQHRCVPPREQIEYLTPEQAEQAPDAQPVPPLGGDDSPRYFRRVAVEDGVRGDPPYPVGSLWRCSCGRVWEVCPPVQSATFISLVNRWAPVGRLRWLRRQWRRSRRR